MPSKPKNLGSAWSFSHLWNQALQSIPERPLVKRQHIWASELGGAYIDRYLKMHATPYTNPPNDRSRRKFAAGLVWEFLISLVLSVCGILKQKQLKGMVELPGLLAVSGKLDFIAGGPVDWEKARFEIENIKKLFSICVDEMPPLIFHAVETIFVAMEREFRNKPLKEIVFECKAISSFMSEKIQKTGKAQPHNVFQCGHYLLANKMDEAKLGYICKDDCISQEFAVFNNKELLKAYKNDVEIMTGYIKSASKNIMKSLPPLEPEVQFVEGLYRFEKNYKVEYSPYLEMLYGYKTPEIYRFKWQRNVASWNRVFKRCVRMENMTDNNKRVIKEVLQLFPEWDKYVQKARSEGVFAKEEEVEDE